MPTNDRASPLHEWNQLARDNAENEIIGLMHETTAQSAEPLATFSGWLFLGAAAVASFMITNSEKMLTFLGSGGFVSCGVLLCASCAFGLVAKGFAVRCQIGIQISAGLKRTFLAHLKAYDAERAEILVHAAKHGIELETGIRMDRVLREYFAPWPRSVVWLSSRFLAKNSGNPQIGNLLLLRSVMWLGALTFLQSFSFLAFLAAGFLYALIYQP